MKRPLEDLHFLEVPGPAAPLGVRIAIALAGRMAADLGAKVTQVVDVSDPLMATPPFVHGASALYAFLNAGKHLLAPDEVAQLRSKVDVRLNWSEDVCSDSSARVEVRVAMLGARAPKNIPASEFTVLALSGLLNLVGDPDREPLRLAGHQAAYAAGLSAFTGALGALCTGTQELVHVSLLEAAVWLNWKNVVAAASNDAAPSRAGRRSDWPVIRCKDGWVALVYQNSDWLKLCALAGNDARLLDPSLLHQATRTQRAEEVARIFEEAWKDRTRAELEQAFLAARVPSGPVWSPAELARDSQYLERGVVQPLELDAEGHKAYFPRLPVLWNGESFPAGSFPLRLIEEACS